MDIIDLFDLQSCLAQDLPHNTNKHHKQRDIHACALDCRNYAIRNVVQTDVNY